MAIDTLAPWQAIDEHLTCVENYIKALVPRSVTVMQYGGRFDNVESFKNHIKKPPVILMSLAQTKVISTNIVGSEQQQDIELSITLNIITDDRPGIDRHILAKRLVHLLSTQIPKRKLGNDNAHLAGNIDARNLYTAQLEQKLNIALWGAVFKQQIHIEQPVQASPIADALLYSEAPNIGTDHQQDYQPLEPCKG